MDVVGVSCWWWAWPVQTVGGGCGRCRLLVVGVVSVG